MRRSRTKNRKEKGFNRTIIIIIALVLLPILSITIGYYGTKYFLIPKFFSQENETVEKGKNTNEEHVPEVENRDEEKPEENTSSEEEKLEEEKEKTYNFEIPAISIYSVQVGSFDDVIHAQKLVEELKGKGLDGYIIKTDRYKVLTRTFLDRENADKYKNNVRELYSDAFILTINMATRSVPYGEEDKNYGESIEKEIVKLNNILTEFYTFLNKRDFERDKVLQFIDSEINKLNEIERTVSNYSPGKDLKTISQNLLNIINSMNTKLKDLKSLTTITENHLWNIFNEGATKYINII